MPKNQWSAKFSYLVGLMATDGCLSSDGRHIDFTSKDLEQLDNFQKCLGKKYPTKYKISGFSERRYPYISFSNVELYKRLEAVGLHPNKSKTIGKLDIPDRYFFDFLRGHLDGDGCFYSYWDRRWRSSFMYYLQFSSASEEHIHWLKETIARLLNVDGKIHFTSKVYHLVFAKQSSLSLVNNIYRKKRCICLSRKREKIFNAI
jgi:hypothetical protein